MPVTLCLTHDCNLRCRYCYAGCKRPERMSVETARLGIDLALSDHIRRGRDRPFDLGFFGGEPLLEWELLREADAYAEERCRAEGVRLRRTVTTNLTLLTPERVAWFGERRYLLGCSIDGCARMHDFFRVFPDGAGSHAAALRGLRLLRGYPGRKDAICVLNPETVSLLPESVRFLLSETDAHICVNPNFSAKWTPEALAALERAYTEVADIVRNSYRAGCPVHVNVLDGKIHNLLTEGYRPCQRCEPVTRELAVAPSGNLYPCPNLVGDDDRVELRLGDVRNGLNSAAVLRALARTGCHSPECEGCPIRARCMNGCCCANYFSSGATDRVSPFLCFHEKLCVRLADALASDLLAEKNEPFLRAFCS